MPLLSLPQIKQYPFVVFLQNAWSYCYAGKVWPRDSWLTALEHCKSGQRLYQLVDDLNCVENTTPIVGLGPSSIVPPDPKHIRDILARRTPKVVIACGKQAEEALSKYWNGALMVVPHPASRMLTNALYAEARRLMGVMSYERIALRQMKGSVRVEFLDGSTAGEIMRTSLDNRK